MQSNYHVDHKYELDDYIMQPSLSGAVFETQHGTVMG